MTGPHENTPTRVEDVDPIEPTSQLITQPACIDLRDLCDLMDASKDMVVCLHASNNDRDRVLFTAMEGHFYLERIANGKHVGHYLDKWHSDEVTRLDSITKGLPFDLTLHQGFRLEIIPHKKGGVPIPLWMETGKPSSAFYRNVMSTSLNQMSLEKFVRRHDLGENMPDESIVNSLNLHRAAILALFITSLAFAAATFTQSREGNEPEATQLNTPQHLENE